MNNRSTFFKYVIPSIIAFALSGIYAIVDGYFVGNFLVSVPFVAITRISTAGFYATEKAALSYILTFIEPVLMLGLMLILPPLFGGQIMIWWSTVFARIISAILALLRKRFIF